MTRNKVLRTILPILITLALGGGLYYYAPPALNIHDSRLWWTVIFLLVIYGFLRLIAGRRTLIENGRPNFKGFLGFAAAAVLAIVFMVIGLFCGYEDPQNHAEKTAHYKRIQELAAEFRAQNGSIVCRELLGLNQTGASSPIPEQRTEAYYKKRPCKELVGDAAKMTAAYLLRNESML